MKSKKKESLSPLTRKGSLTTKHTLETPNFSIKVENIQRSDKNIKDFADSERKSIKETKSIIDFRINIIFNFNEILLINLKKNFFYEDNEN